MLKTHQFKSTRTFFFLVLVTSMVITSNSWADIDEVRQYIANSPDTAYLVNGTNDLRVVDQIRGRKVTDVYQKMVNGTALHGGFVRVNRDAKGQINGIIDSSSRHLQFLAIVPTVAAEQAIGILENDLQDLTPTGSTSEMVWFRTGQNARPAWEITTQIADTGAAVSPTGLLSVIDANTGDLLSQSQIDTNDYEAEGLENNQGIFPRIVINNAIGTAGSRAYSAPFDSVVALAFGCTGVLIDDNIVLSARHCGAFAGDTIIFGDNSNGGGDFTATVQSSFLPDGGGSLLDGGDVAILTLNSNVPANIAQPMRLIDATDELEDMVCSMHGYGFNGLGSQGHGFTDDGRRWGGENIIDRYGSPAGAGGSNVISTDFDNGSNGANTIGGSSSTPLEFEATTAPGDSGGPILVQVNGEWLVAGVLSGGTTNNSVYGDISWWTGTADFRTAIENRGGVFADTNAVLLGDINLDGVINLLDVSPFVDLIGSGMFQAEGDMNQDGTINLLDVGLFVEALSS